MEFLWSGVVWGCSRTAIVTKSGELLQEPMRTYSVHSTRYFLQPPRCQRLLYHSIGAAPFTGRHRKSGVQLSIVQSAPHLPPRNFPRGQVFLTYV